MDAQNNSVDRVLDDLMLLGLMNIEKSKRQGAEAVSCWDHRPGTTVICKIKFFIFYKILGVYYGREDEIRISEHKVPSSTSR